MWIEVAYTNVIFKDDIIKQNIKCIFVVVENYPTNHKNKIHVNNKTNQTSQTEYLSIVLTFML